MPPPSPAPVHPQIVGKKLREALEDLGRSPGWLSRATGIGQTTIYSILSGRHMASPPKLAAICDALSISVDVVLDVEPHMLPLFPENHAEARVYASFERIWFGEGGGDRISVSRGFSVANQSEELRRAILRHVYRFAGEALDTALSAFHERRKVIHELERSRLEIVVESEVEDFVRRRKPWDAIEPELVHGCIEGVVDRLEHDPERFEVVVIPRERFLVNYEIIAREVILFDAGTVFLRHTHPRILEHFLREVETFQRVDALHRDREDVVRWLRGLVEDARAGVAVERAS